VQTHPLESWFLAVHGVALFNQPNRLQHVGDIVESSDLSFELLISFVVSIGSFAIGYFLSSFFQAQDVFPGYEKMNELLAQDAQGFLFFVVFDFAASCYRYFKQNFGVLFLRHDLDKVGKEDLGVGGFLLAGSRLGFQLNTPFFPAALTSLVCLLGLVCFCLFNLGLSKAL